MAKKPAAHIPDDQPARKPRKKPAARQPKIPVNLAPPTRDQAAIFFADALSVRHREWLKAAARANGETVGQLIERLIRMAYAGDRTKGGTISGGATVLAKDFHGE